MANQTIELGPIERSAVREMANIGLGHATTSLATLTGRPYTMSVPDADAVALEDIPVHLGGGELMAAGIFMAIDGDTGGHIAFLLPWPSAAALVEMLTMERPDEPSTLTELHASALLEVGNIINSSFLVALGEMTQLRMESTPPSMCVDMSVAVLNAIVCEAASADSAALAVRTSIQDESASVEGYFVFIPTVGGLRQLFRNLGIPEAA